MLPFVLIAGAITGAAGFAMARDVSSGRSGSQTAGPRIAGADPFIDRFDARDPERWSVSHNWSNGDWAANDWQRSQSRFGKGLSLTLAPAVADSAPFSSGEVQSRDTFGHGYYETSMRAAPGSGIVTGFFTYTGPYFGKEWNEIDVEVLGARPREVLLTYFLGEEKISKAVPLGFDATKSHHHYAFDWQPGSLAWYVDGKLVHRERGGTVPLPRERQKIMMSVWASQTLTDWVGPFDTNALPSTAHFACVAYNPGMARGGKCRQDGADRP